MAIQIQHLSKAFDSKPVLADFSAEIPEKAVTCLMGESGCGKTTLLYLLAGLISPDAGKISGISGKIAFVFQENRLAENFTVYRNLKMVCKGQKISKEMLGEMLENVGMDKALLHAPVSSLSGGMKRRVAILRALLCDSAILFLDEPTTGLHFADIQQLLDVLHKLRDQGNTIVVIEHNLDVIKTADWIVDLGPEGGSGGGEILVSGTPETVAECEASHTARFLKPMLK